LDPVDKDGRIDPMSRNRDALAVEKIGDTVKRN
jgi:hypothetical protein